MAALPAFSPSSQLAQSIQELWQLHREEERSLHQLPEAALMCAEIFMRLPHDTSFVLGTQAHPDYPHGDITGLHRALIDAYGDLLHARHNGAEFRKLANVFSALRLQAGLYDYIAMRILAKGVVAHADHASDFIHFKSARRQFSLAVDQAIALLETRIHAAFLDCNATQFLSLAAANDIARIVLRRYVHDGELPMGVMDFLSEFVVRYRQRLTERGAED